MPASPHAAPTPSTPLRMFGVAMALAVILAWVSLALLPDVLAQDGTGAATPTPPTDCFPPRATVTEEEMAAPIATEGAAATEIASPAASPVASPAASPVAVANQAALQVDITETTRILAVCLSEGKFDRVAGMTGDAFRGRLLGVAEDVDAATYASVAAALIPAPYRIVSVTNIARVDIDRATATVVYQVARQLRAGTWTFQLTGSGAARAWVVDSEETTEVRPPSHATRIDVRMTDDGYTLSADRATGTAVVLAGTNDDAEDHEMLVVRLGFGVTADDLLTTPGPALPPGVTFVGQLTVPAGSSGSLVLTDLEPGRYTVVDLLPDEEGVPHLAGGMSDTFTIAAP